MEQDVWRGLRKLALKGLERDCLSRVAKGTKWLAVVVARNCPQYADQFNVESPLGTFHDIHLNYMAHAATESQAEPSFTGHLNHQAIMNA
jgi:hypothetical protein